MKKKIKRIQEDTSIFFEILDRTPKESKNYVSKSLEIVNQIHVLLTQRNLTQRQLADKTQKSEAEVSKWLSGSHNFTIRTLAAIETALGEDIIITPNKLRGNFLQYAAKIYNASINEKYVRAKPIKSEYRIKTSKEKTGFTQLQVA